MGWEGRNKSDVAQDEPGVEFPFIQWVNRGGDLDPRRKDGGWFMTSANVDMLRALPVGASGATMNFSTGDTEDGVFIEQIVVAPLVTRFAWATRDGNRYAYSQTYVAGARGKLNLLAYIQTDDGPRGPVSITLTGTVTKDLSEALKVHRQRVHKATRGEAPSPLFYLTLQPGPQVLRGSAGQQSKVTPIVLVDDFDPDRDFVGDDLADEIEARWQEFKDWREKWGQQQHDDEESTTDEEDYGTSSNHAPAPEKKRSASEMDAARTRWSKAWNALKKRGIATAFLNNAHSVEQVNACAAIMEDALAVLDGGKQVDQDKLAADLASI